MLNPKLIIIITSIALLQGCLTKPDKGVYLGALGSGNQEMISKQESAGIKRQDIYNNYGQRPIHIVALQGNKNLLNYLLETGSDINATNKSGQTPLMLALTSNNAALTKWLLRKGANANIADSNGKTTLEQALKNNDEFELIQQLLDSGVRPHANQGYAITLGVESDKPKVKDLFETIILKKSVNPAMMINPA